MHKSLFSRIYGSDHDLCIKVYTKKRHLQILLIFYHSWSSVVIRGHLWSFEVTRGHSWSFVVIRGHSWSLVVIRGHSYVLLDMIV